MRFPFRPWGLEERSDEAPRAGRARPTPDPEVVAQPKRRRSPQSIGCGFWRRRIAAHSPARWAACFAARGCTAPSGARLAAGVEARNRPNATRWMRRCARSTQVARLEPELHTAHTILDVVAGLCARTRNALVGLAAQVGVAPACQALGVSRRASTVVRGQLPGTGSPERPPALCEAEREQILDVLAGALRTVRRRRSHARRPLPVLRTMYRTWPERRNPHAARATSVGADQGRTTRVVSALAGRLIEETWGAHPALGDRGAPMTSKCTAQLLADLGVTRSLSRPQVSDDNPFSEAQFKTLKYHPGFPGRFHDITAAIAFCRTFFPWYNTEHRHAGSMRTTSITIDEPLSGNFTVFGPEKHAPEARAAFPGSRRPFPRTGRRDDIRDSSSVFRAHTHHGEVGRHRPRPLPARPRRIAEPVR